MFTCSSNHSLVYRLYENVLLLNVLIVFKDKLNMLKSVPQTALTFALFHQQTLMIIRSFKYTKTNNETCKVCWQQYISKISPFQVAGNLEAYNTIVAIKFRIIVRACKNGAWESKEHRHVPISIACKQCF